MKKLSAVLCACLIILAGGSAQAYIIDTGAPLIPSGGPALERRIGTGIEDDGYEYFQWLAGRVTLTQSRTITSIESYLGRPFSAGDVTVAVYGNNETGVDTADVRFTDTFYSGSLDPEGWNGLYDQSLFLDPGTYWFAFEVRGPSVYSGYLTTSINGSVPDPLEAYAVTGDLRYPQWEIGGVPAVALRLGEPVQSNNAIPEPATLLLVVIGCMCMASVNKIWRGDA